MNGHPNKRASARTSSLLLLCGLSVSLSVVGCGDSGEAPPAPSAAPDEGPAETYELDIPEVEYAWDPQAGDPGVPAELGGPGFTGEGWETRLRFPALGAAEAVKGGEFVMDIPSWPDNLRQDGENWNTSFNYRTRDLAMEALLYVHDNTLEFIPRIATHWQRVSNDDGTQTYRYRINPAARFSDGHPITSEDVVFSWNFRLDPGLNYPSNQIIWGKFNEPVAVSKYIVEVTPLVENWRNFLYFSASLTIFPAHELSQYTAAEYLDEYQNRIHAVSGPYTIDMEDFSLNQFVTLKRRSDWWAKDNPAWQGLFNFDRYRFLVVQDTTLAFEKMKKGELDYYVIPKAQWWVEELPQADLIQRGVMVRRKFWNDAPVGTSGLAINMTRAPLDDLRVRKALSHLRDLDTYIEKLFFNQYAKLTSYWQGPTYGNPDNVVLDYDPMTAVELLESAGWTERGRDGIRIQAGKRLSFELSYRSELSEPNLTTYQQDCREAGIEILLKRIDPATFWTNLREREYDLSSMAWGALVFPNPETSYKGELAEQKQNNNVTAFSDPRVDELLVLYDREHDVSRRADLIREIDAIVHAATPYVLDWYNPAQRVVYKNKFRMPEWGCWRTKDRTDLMYCWWIDPELDAQSEHALEDDSVVMQAPSVHHRFWQAWNAAQEL